MYARYTEYLRDLMNNEGAKAALDKALSTYPLYEPLKLYDLIPKRSELNQRLLNHYKYREIGFETVGRFLDELEITMCEIMPRYNELFKTVETMAELPSPFDNVDVTETFEQEQSNTSTSEGSSTNQQSGSHTSTATGSTEMTANNKRLTADTPQDQISVPTKDIDGVTYASEAEWNESLSQGTDNRQESGSSEGTAENSSTASSESTGTLKHTFTKKGNQGVNTYAHDMNEFRTSIIDVVDQIINDQRIQELFMQIY